MSGPRKAVILARGLGTRMRQDAAVALSPGQRDVAASGVKALMPVGRPFLDYGLSALADAGFDDICLVIGPEHDAIRARYDARALRRVRVCFAIQERPLGTADAVLAAEPFVGHEPFLVLNSDNYYPVDSYRALRRLPGAGLAAFRRRTLTQRSRIPADRVSAFAVLDVAPDGSLRRIVEQPGPAELDAFGDDPLVSVNCWRFDPAIFDACRDVGRSPRGEFELPIAVQHAIDTRSARLTVVSSDGTVLDLSTRLDVGPVAEALRDVVVAL